MKGNSTPFSETDPCFAPAPGLVVEGSRIDQHGAIEHRSARVFSAVHPDPSKKSSRLRSITASSVETQSDKLPLMGQKRGRSFVSFAPHRPDRRRALFPSRLYWQAVCIRFRSELVFAGSNELALFSAEPSRRHTYLPSGLSLDLNILAGYLRR